MEVEEEIQTKFPRIGSSNGRSSGEFHKLGQKGEDQFPIHDDQEDGREEEEVVAKRNDILLRRGAANEIGGLRWPSSRIVRVSRASGGKDRHSKVWTSKGLRDRRVRLSVTTAIQFYDLQDRLGVDQPSKAVEWLLKAASGSINELPEINTSFPDTPPKQISDEKNSSAEALEMDGDSNFQLQNQNQNQNQNQHASLSKSACSSNSENSKGSGLSLSRSENRIKARERARERAAEKDKKDKENEPLNPISQSSFTELLTGANETAQQQNHGNNGEQNLFQKPTRQWSAIPMDYFAAASGLLGPSSSTSTTRNHQSGFSGPMHLGQNSPYTTSVVAGGGGGGDHHYHPELQQFSFVPDHLGHSAAAATGGNDNYNLNFTISSSSPSGLSGFNRGTLQSNTQSPSLLPHLQRFTAATTTTTATDGSSNVNVPFFTVENHHHHHLHHPHPHQLPPGLLDGRLQLFNGYGGTRHSDHKGKGKN